MLSGSGEDQLPILPRACGPYVCQKEARRHYGNSIYTQRRLQKTGGFEQKQMERATG